MGYFLYILGVECWFVILFVDYVTNHPVTPFFCYEGKNSKIFKRCYKFNSYKRDICIQMLAERIKIFQSIRIYV